MEKIVNKKKFQGIFDKKVEKLDSINANFIILNDGTDINSKDLFELIDTINAFNYNVQVLNLEIIMKKVLVHLKQKTIDSLTFDTILLLGEGGKRAFDCIRDDELFSNKTIIQLKWSRVWNEDTSDEFITNIDSFDLKNRKIIVFEDVIASGETLYNLYLKIIENGGILNEIIAGLIQETSPLNDRSFVKLLIGEMVEKSHNVCDDPFWYPPIYSLRHLLYGDMEMESFYSVLNEKYFSNNNIIEKKIKEMRDVFYGK